MLLCRCAALAVGLFMLAGCQPLVSSQLLGDWRGVPDSAPQQSARQQQRLAAAIANDPSAAKSARAQVAEEAAKTPVPPSDIEDLDFAVSLQFAARGKVTMQLDSSPPRAGTWQVIESRPSGALIQITQLSASDDKTPEKRRFEIEFESDDPLDGFRLREAGADRRFGQLYFTPAAAKPVRTQESRP